MESKESWREPGGSTAILLVRQNARAGSCGGCPRAKLKQERREEVWLLQPWQAVLRARSWQAAREAGQLLEGAPGG